MKDWDVSWIKPDWKHLSLCARSTVCSSEVWVCWENKRNVQWQECWIFVLQTEGIYSAPIAILGGYKSLSSTEDKDNDIDDAIKVLMAADSTYVADEWQSGTKKMKAKVRQDVISCIIIQ